ncbi:hypothetical protein DPMN_097491 [Dreissena polymorpha]|uniref:Uncharacterized protein n=1 Tax=Dreissena polymorpha TaxID=45954 RepID=A0A9D4LAD0_DREPO|nr:hypothetical protein DPMN_097491 [Dreissena polymorpha]
MWTAKANLERNTIHSFGVARSLGPATPSGCHYATGRADTPRRKRPTVDRCWTPTTALGYLRDEFNLKANFRGVVLPCNVARIKRREGEGVGIAERINSAHLAKTALGREGKIALPFSSTADLVFIITPLRRLLAVGAAGFGPGYKKKTLPVAVGAAGFGPGYQKKTPPSAEGTIVADLRGCFDRSSPRGDEIHRLDISQPNRRFEFAHLLALALGTAPPRGAKTRCTMAATISNVLWHPGRVPSPHTPVERGFANEDT